MPYITIDNLLTRYGDEMVDIAGSGDPRVINEDKVTLAIANAEAEIDAYLAQRYELPLSPPPQVVIDLAADIARYKLRDTAENGGGEIAEVVSQRYADATRRLQALATGTQSLGSGYPIQTHTSSLRVAAKGQEAVFADGGIRPYQRRFTV
ncbi:MAG: DUF1320 domain-containing protein [Alphaproteobacteria bacterium]|nr:DUF1320 domain-containing protein [Alphaproteobacteria bacterium]